MKSQNAVAILGLIAFVALAGGTQVETLMLGTVGQQSVSATEVEELEQQLDALRTNVERLAPGSRRDDMERQLAELDDEIAYLRVMLRREAVVPNSDLDRVRTGIAGLRSELDEDPVASTNDDTVTIPVGTEVNVRLQSTLDSDTAEVEDRFFATFVEDLRVQGRVAVPSGAEVRGVVSNVERSSRTRRGASLTLTFDQLSTAGQTYPVRMTLTEAQETGLRDEADRIGLGCGCRWRDRWTPGWCQGCPDRHPHRGGWTVAATQGEDVELPAGTLLRIRFDSPVDVRLASQ